MSPEPRDEAPHRRITIPVLGTQTEAEVEGVQE